MKSFGEAIRKLRVENGLPLRVVAAYLDIDQAILSKIERGKRNAKREQVIMLSQFFKDKEQKLLLLWLSDNLYYSIADEELAHEALQLAEEKISYQSVHKMDLNTLISHIKNVIRHDGRIATAWLFGSVVKKATRPESDVDIIIEFNQEKKYSMFDLLDIAHAIEGKIDRKVDIVEKGQLKAFALKTASDNLLKIYG